jgi:hypothetical protein
MSAASPQPMIGRCSAQSRSFLLGPCGPAGAPPGQRLRSGVTWQLRRSGTSKISQNQSVHTFKGNPEETAAKWDELRAKARQGPQPTSTPTVNAYLTRWLDEVIRPHDRPATYALYEMLVRCYIRLHLGKKRLDRLAVRDV